jgi:hypothetical protein
MFKIKRTAARPVATDNNYVSDGQLKSHLSSLIRAFRGVRKRQE